MPLDLTEPMMIEGMPDTTISHVQILTPHVIQGIVRRGAFTTQITFRNNGWVSSTTYATDRVINRSTHEATVKAKEQEGIAHMEANDLWGSF